MAAKTLVARRLTEGHRVGQLHLGASLTAQVTAVWSLLDVDDLDGSTPGWLAVLRPLVQATYVRSANLTATYLRVFRALELPEEEPFAPVVAAGLVESRLTASLLVTGPVAVKARIGAGKGEDLAMSLSSVGVAGAGQRLGLDGGRDTLTDTVQADPRAAGYERVTSSGCCDFCQMLADRGAVYSEGTVEFEAHDHCGCSGEPVYRS